MGSLATQTTTAVLDTVLAGRPEVRGRLTELWDLAWQATDPYVLELCRVRIAMLLGCTAESDATERTPAATAAGLEDATVAALAMWTTDPRFRPVDRACLAFTEQFVIDVANLNDATVGEVRIHLGEVGLQDFLSALLVVEQRQRLRLAWDALFPEGV